MKNNRNFIGVSIEERKKIWLTENLWRENWFYTFHASSANISEEEAIESLPLLLDAVDLKKTSPSGERGKEQKVINFIKIIFLIED